MNRQRDLFPSKPHWTDLRRAESALKRKSPNDWHGDVEPEERKGRLSAQCVEILNALRERPQTNRELAMISLKYTGRISDLRAAGYTVTCSKRDRVTGCTTYTLSE